MPWKILGLAVAAWRRRRHDPQQLLGVPLGLFGLVIFQALLGMWTVTLLVKPAIVTAHLLGGMATVGLGLLGAAAVTAVVLLILLFSAGLSTSAFHVPAPLMVAELSVFGSGT